MGVGQDPWTAAAGDQAVDRFDRRQYEAGDGPTSMTSRGSASSPASPGTADCAACSRCTAERAFEILGRASQNRDVKLRGLARDIVENVTGQPPSPRPPRTREAPPGHGRADAFRPTGQG